MKFGEINYIVVFLAAIASMVIGMFWYSPSIFGKEWMKMMGPKAKDMGKMDADTKKSIAIGFLVSLLGAYVLAHFVNWFQLETIQEAVQFSFWTWLGFIAAVQFSDMLWTKSPMKLFYINGGYRLVALVVMTSILTLWG